MTGCPRRRCAILCIRCSCETSARSGSGRSWGATSSGDCPISWPRTTFSSWSDGRSRLCPDRLLTISLSGARHLLHRIGPSVRPDVGTPESSAWSRAEEFGLRRVAVRHGGEKATKDEHQKKQESPDYSATTRSPVERGIHLEGNIRPASDWELPEPLAHPLNRRKGSRRRRASQRPQARTSRGR